MAQILRVRYLEQEAERVAMLLFEFALSFPETPLARNGA
jgi:hypothetical protein